MILFRVNASQKIGTGHLLECLWLARALKQKSIFVVNKDAAALKLVRQFGFPIYTESLSKIIKEKRPDLVVFDFVDIKSSDVWAAKKAGAKILVMNLLKRLDFADRQIVTVFGVEHILLKPALKNFAPRKISRTVKNIFVMFGGADPGHFTLKTLRALSKLQPDFKTTVVAGSANKNFREISNYLKTYPKPHRLYRNITDERKLARLMRESDLGLCSGGYTTAEFMYLGVPTIALAQNETESRRIFSNFPKDSFVYRGLGRNITGRRLAAAAQNLMKNFSARKAMAKKARRVVDGQGIARVKKIVSKLIN